MGNVTWACKKGILPLVIDDDCIMFMSQSLNIFQKPKLISNIPNIKNILLLEDIPQNQCWLKMDKLRIEVRQKRRKFQNFLRNVRNVVRFHRLFLPSIIMFGIINSFIFSELWFQKINK